MNRVKYNYWHNFLTTKDRKMRFAEINGTKKLGSFKNVWKDFKQRECDSGGKYLYGNSHWETPHFKDLEK